MKTNASVPNVSDGYQVNHTPTPLPSNKTSALALEISSLNARIQALIPEHLAFGDELSSLRDDIDTMLGSAHTQPIMIPGRERAMTHLASSDDDDEATLRTTLETLRLALKALETSSPKSDTHPNKIRRDTDEFEGNINPAPKNSPIAQRKVKRSNSK